MELPVCKSVRSGLCPDGHVHIGFFDADDNLIYEATLDDHIAGYDLAQQLLRIYDRAENIK